MASSRKLKSSNLSDTIENVLCGQVRSGNHLVVALSGGIDSVVLLNLLIRLSAQFSFSLSAIHINHGISINATEWSIFCRDLCRSSGISLKISRLKIRREPGISLEAAAREERYRIFGKLKADYVVLAQHLDDQAETLLLQLLRGAGVKGLGAMPAVRNPASEIGTGAGAGIAEKTPESKPNEGPKILRPMLEVSRREIEDYAREHGLQWVTDESNVDVSFDRNFLRHELFPVLERRFPSYRNTFLRASRHMAEASTLLDELAEADSKGCAASGKIYIDELRKLSFPRARNLLRYTLSQQGAILPSTAKLDEMLRQLLSSRPDAKMHVVFGNAEIRCFRGEVHVGKASIRKIGAVAAQEEWLRWHGERQLAIGEQGGIIRFARRKGAGINLKKLIESPVTVRFRQGGERLRPDCNRPRRSLKNLLREALLPPWERQALPLIFSGENLACVPGIGVECDFQAIPGEQGLVVSWQRDGG